MENIFTKLKHFITVKRCEYSEQKFEERYKFIWGIKSYDDLSGAPANHYTMNDIDIIFDNKTKLYILEIETAYIFEQDKQGEVEYLNKLLKYFTEFMESNNYDTQDSFLFYMSNPCITYKAETIPELYTQFRIFTEGYTAVYGKNE